MLKDSSIFYLADGGSLNFSKLDKTLFLQGLQIDMNFDLTIVSRTGYTVLDILGDVGGL